MDSRRFDDNWKLSKKRGRKLLGDGNEKPSKKAKGRILLAPGKCLPHRRLFLTKPSKKGKGRNALGQGNGKPSNKGRKSHGSASKGVSELPANDPALVEMWREYCYYHDHNLCIKSLGRKPYEELTLEEAMLRTVEGVEVEPEFASLHFEFEGEDSI